MLYPMIQFVSGRLKSVIIFVAFLHEMVTPFDLPTPNNVVINIETDRMARWSSAKDHKDTHIAIEVFHEFDARFSTQLLKSAMRVTHLKCEATTCASRIIWYKFSMFFYKAATVRIHLFPTWTILSNLSPFCFYPEQVRVREPSYIFIVPNLIVESLEFTLNTNLCHLLLLLLFKKKKTVYVV